MFKWYSRWQKRKESLIVCDGYFVNTPEHRKKSNLTKILEHPRRFQSNLDSKISLKNVKNSRKSRKNMQNPMKHFRNAKECLEIPFSTNIFIQSRVILQISQKNLLASRKLSKTPLSLFVPPPKTKSKNSNRKKYEKKLVGKMIIKNPKRGVRNPKDPKQSQKTSETKSPRDTQRGQLADKKKGTIRMPIVPKNPKIMPRVTERIFHKQQCQYLIRFQTGRPFGVFPCRYVFVIVDESDYLPAFTIQLFPTINLSRFTIDGSSIPPSLSFFFSSEKRPLFWSNQPNSWIIARIFFSRFLSII